LAFTRIEEDWVPSSWKDSLADSRLNPNFSIYTQVPTFGAFTDKRVVHFAAPVEEVQKMIWSLGGDRGWLAMNWAWSLRGFIDKLVGGVGLRRGRTHPTRLKAGDALDFWRVLLADEKNRRLLLYAEMKLPGEAWLEFKVLSQGKKGGELQQTATFRPHGIWGRFYWFALYPFHAFIFHRLSLVIAKKLS
jgi:hypothetical protein